MSSFVVRRAVVADAESFSACHLACWREAYTELWGADRFAEIDPVKLAARRRAEIENNVADHFLAEADGEVIGIAIAGPGKDDNPPVERELYAIFVRAHYQGSGVADDLLNVAVDGQPAYLWTYRDNPRASAFYVHHDFIPDGDEHLDSQGILEIRMVRR